MAQEDALGSKETVLSSFPNPGPCYLFPLLLSPPGAGSPKIHLPSLLGSKGGPVTLLAHESQAEAGWEFLGEPSLLHQPRPSSFPLPRFVLTQ